MALDQPGPTGPKRCFAVRSGELLSRKYFETIRAPGVAA